jgi:FkbM family methyltransferase
MSVSDEELERLRKAAEEAEFHAFGVRQMIALRDRLYQVLRVTGIVAEFDGRPPSGGPRRQGASNLAQVLSTVEKTKSQFMQDVFCMLLNQGKRNGFFVEFGACDGLALSNTILLERDFGWRGILAEPSRTWLPEIVKNRTCTIERRCVWSETGPRLEFAEFWNDESNTRSGLLASSDEDLTLKQTYMVDTISLVDMLREHDAPRHIDFMSVDTEGSELDILKAFPFGDYTFGFLAVEHKTPETEIPIKALLEGVGYRQVLRTASGHDGYYVLKTEFVGSF